MKSQGSLPRLLKRFFNGEKKHYQDGKWSIGVGGYDLNWELYLNNVAIIQCIAGQKELTVCNKDGEKYISKVQKIVDIYRW